MFSLISLALSWVIKFIFPSRKDPTAVDLAASNATAQTQLASQETNNEILDAAAAVRTSADARVLRESAEPGSASKPASTGLDADSEGHWRD